MEFKNTAKAIDEFGKALVDTYKGHLEELHYNNGELYRSIQYTVSSEGRDWLVSISLESYWKYVENGRGPGKFPPLDVIQYWIEVKQIVPQMMTLKSGKTVIPSVPQLSFLIARKIAREGTQGHHVWEQTYNQVKKEHLEKIKSAIEQDLKENLIFH